MTDVPEQMLFEEAAIAICGTSTGFTAITTAFEVTCAVVAQTALLVMVTLMVSLLLNELVVKLTALVPTD